MDISKEVSAAIQANLPAAVGEELKFRLAQASELEKKNAELEYGKTQLREMLTKEQAKTAQLTEQMSDWGILRTRENDVAAKERATQKREDGLELELQKLIAAEANRRADAMRGFLGTLTKSPVVRESLQSNVQLQPLATRYNSQTGQSDTQYTESGRLETKTTDVVE